MRKKHLRIAKLLNQFHFKGHKHTDEAVEGFVECWRNMQGDVSKLAEIANTLDFCYQNRHFIKKYPQVVEMMHGADAEAAFITFHALGGVYPLRKPGEARVSIGDHMTTLIQAKADNAADEPQNQQFVGRLKVGAGKTGVELDGEIPNPAMKRLTVEEMENWKRSRGEPGVEVSIDPDAPRNPDGSLNDIVVLGGGRFGRPGMGSNLSRARLYRDLDTPSVVSEANVESMLIKASGLSYLTPGDLKGLDKTDPVLDSPFQGEYAHRKAQLAYFMRENPTGEVPPLNLPLPVEQTVLAYAEADGLDKLTPDQLRAQAENAVNTTGFKPRHVRQAEEAVESLKDFDKPDEPNQPE